MPAWTGDARWGMVKHLRSTVLRFTFAPRTLKGYIPFRATPYYHSRWSRMMKKAGYFQRTGCIAYDSEGSPHEIIELYILGERYAVRRAELARAIGGRVHVQVESLTHNWNYYLGAVSGLAQVSVSGKALNIDLFNAGDFTVSLKGLRAVMYGRERSAVIVRIPDTPAYQRSSLKKGAPGQRHLGATA